MLTTAKYSPIDIISNTNIPIGVFTILIVADIFYNLMYNIFFYHITIYLLSKNVESNHDSPVLF